MYQNKGTLDALIRPLHVQSLDTKTHPIPSASESSTDRTPITIRYSTLNKSHQIQPPQRSVGSPKISIKQSRPRHSARLADTHPPQDSSTSASLRQSAQLNSTQRR
ncbi:unnamed protein product [Penicillium salamii]|nr:unnamed protein product [Penicillium salamii]